MNHSSTTFHYCLTSRSGTPGTIMSYEGSPAEQILQLVLCLAVADHEAA
jgi:hypothetical protein